MDFNNKVDNEKPSTYFTPTSASASASGDGYFTEQALRAIQRELEKERIRDEIIAEERRVLELEVRRELLLERELAMQRRSHAHGFSLMATSASILRADPRLSMMIHPESGGRIDESFAAFPTRAEVGMHQAEGPRLEERLSLPPPSEVGVLEKLPLQSSEPHVKPLSDVGKGQVLFFAKPINSLSGMKRKVVEPPSTITGAVQLPSAISKKKPPQEWSCALCQVSATSEKGLNDHVQGRKHKAKEAALVASKTTSRNTGGSTPSTKGNDKPTKTPNTTNNPKSKKGKKQEGNKQQPPIKQEGDETVQKKKPEALKKKYKFWCEMCQVGTHGRTVMASHQKGKKHLSLLEKWKKENESIPATTTPSESTNQKPKNVDTEATLANGEVDGVVDADKKEASDAKDDESAAAMQKVDRSSFEESTELKDDDSDPSSVAVGLVEGNEN